MADIGTFFRLNMTPKQGDLSEKASQEVRYAAAALLVVCAKADFEEHPEEMDTIAELLEKTFELDHELIDKLLAYANEDTDTRRLNEFTDLVNRYYSNSEKQLLVENLWRVAFADGRIDQFEEQFINRVAFMIDVNATKVQACRKQADPAN